MTKYDGPVFKNDRHFKFPLYEDQIKKTPNRKITKKQQSAPVYYRDNIKHKAPDALFDDVIHNHNIPEKPVDPFYQNETLRKENQIDKMRIPNEIVQEHPLDEITQQVIANREARQKIFRPTKIPASTIPDKRALNLTKLRKIRKEMYKSVQTYFLFGSPDEELSVNTVETGETNPISFAFDTENETITNEATMILADDQTSIVDKQLPVKNNDSTEENELSEVAAETNLEETNESFKVASDDNDISKNIWQVDLPKDETILTQVEIISPIDKDDEVEPFLADDPVEALEEQQTEMVDKPKHSRLEKSLANIMADESLLQDEDKALSYFHLDEEAKLGDQTIADTLEEIEEDSSEHLAAYHFPSIHLLKPPVKEQQAGMDEWVMEQAITLDDTLKSFNVDATVASWTIGPAVTQFELHLGKGVKVNKITNLNDDLKLALAAKDIRIEAPIPGKNTVGVEISNKISRPVMLSEVMASERFKNSHSPLTVALGVNLFGIPVVTTLEKMPHGLVAGATGSGKSVFINSLLISLLYKASPNEVKLLLIDPKAVELAPYSGLPHLIAPVISEPKAANEALKWVVNEMEERYQKMAAAGVKNIKGYNDKAEEQQEYARKLPYIVIIIDELADLMMIASQEVQDSIARITQKARAAGIHLIVATQRPSVDVITGTIKNNIPTRIAFMVSSQTDSRTILDTGGAEKLLGKGDMLFLGNGATQPVRMQGAFVEAEIDQIVKFVKDQRKTDYWFEPESLMSTIEVSEPEDESYDEVLAYIVEQDSISISKLQRVFRMGYNRAANMIDTLEQQKYISSSNGSKPREVYLTKEQYENLKNPNEV